MHSYLFRLICFFLLSVLGGQALASIHSYDVDEQSYIYDSAVSEGKKYSYDLGEPPWGDQSAGFQADKSSYDGNSNLLLCYGKQSARLSNQNAQEGYFFTLVSGFNVAKGIDDVISSASRPARVDSRDSRALQALKKKIDRGDDAFSGLPKTQDAANDLIRQTLGAKNPVVRTKTRNGQTVRDVFDPSTDRGVKTVDGEFDTFVNLK